MAIQYAIWHGKTAWPTDDRPRPVSTSPLHTKARGQHVLILHSHWHMQYFSYIAILKIVPAPSYRYRFSIVSLSKKYWTGSVAIPASSLSHHVHVSTCTTILRYTCSMLSILECRLWHVCILLIPYLGTRVRTCVYMVLQYWYGHTLWYSVPGTHVLECIAIFIF